MKKFTNPLNDIKIASPCAANWNEMLGDNRQRHCAECQLNVYNLSEMTQTEAENFLINSEGRVCVKFYRRSDGTVLTKDCPVGWKAIKRRLSRTASALASLCFGIIGGFFAFQSLESDTSNLVNEVVVESNKLETENSLIPVIGEVEPENSKLKKVKVERDYNQMVLGRVGSFRRTEVKPVKFQLKRKN